LMVDDCVGLDALVVRAGDRLHGERW
jgi:hypothetical protein